MLIILFLSMMRILPAPGFMELYIVSVAPINYYDPLIKALTYVEVKNGHDLYNENENAVGWFQIRQIRVDDFNNRTGKHYTLNMMYDYNTSKEVFMYYCKGRSYEEIAKSWNGSGKATEIYWNKVKSLL